MTTKNRFIATLATLSMLVPTLALAQSAGVGANVDVSGSASTQTGTSGGVRANAAADVQINGAAATRAKNKAGEEIARRIKALTELSARIGTMTKVSAEFKANLTTNVQNQITVLSSLKTKIDGDTDVETLKTDVRSITQGYRVFVLVMPQARMAAAADREATIINMLVGLGTKLQARLSTAQSAGADVTALGATLTDMGAKIASAQAHAQAAVNGSATLTPDNGDKDKMAANEVALKAARTEIKAAHDDIVAARKDAETIIKALRSLKVQSTSSTTVQTQ